MKILISGYYGFGNVGDEAVLLATINGLKKMGRGIEITVLSETPELTQITHQVAAVKRNNWLAVYNAIKDCDVLLSGGGTLLQNSTSNRSLFYYLSIITTAKMLGKKVVVFSQGLGPLKGLLAKNLTQSALNSCDLIMLRDDDSFQFAKSMNLKSKNLCLTSDVAAALAMPDQKAGAEVLELLNIKKQKPLIGVILREFKNTLFENFSGMLDQFCEKYGFEPVFIPFQPINDAELLAEVMQHMRTKSYLALANLSVSDMLALFTRLDLVLSMRLHGLVFAAMANRPCLGLSYDPKISSFMRSIEQGYVEIAGQIDNKEILTRLDEIMQNQVPYKTSAETLKRKAELNFELLSQVL